MNESIAKKPRRSSWQVAKNVWWAMFVREALSRTMGDRLDWFWLFAQPILLVVVFVIIRTVILGNIKAVSGADYIPWLIIGFLGFQLFRQTMMRPMNAVESNRQLFSYRQVLPIDPVLVRCYIEGLLITFVLILFIFFSGLFGIYLIPYDSVLVLFSWVSLWCLGVGVGLVISVLSVLVPETKNIIPVMMMPLLLLSGVIIPINYLPPDIVHYLLFNPIVHGLELLRSYFFESYQPVQGSNFVYLWLCSFSTLAIGMGMHLRFEQRLKVL